MSRSFFLSFFSFSLTFILFAIENLLQNIIKKSRRILWELQVGKQTHGILSNDQRKKMRHLLKWHICITRVDKLATASFSLSLQSPLLTAEPVYWHRILLVFFSNLSHAHLLARFVYSAAIDSWRFSHIFWVITFVFVINLRFLMTRGKRYFTSQNVHQKQYNYRKKCDKNILK